MVEQIRDIVRQIWGYDTLRPLQEEAIQAGVEQRDTLVVLPTGGGKSLCYQVPPLLEERTDIVVSPLISLMKDQVDGLRANGYPAAALYSGISEAERRKIGADLRSGKLRLLFVAPERLLKDGFLNYLEQNAPIRSFAIDEAHCISHWGHDFRPEYRRLASLRQRFPKASFHAYTATATTRVRGDIIKQLGLVNPHILIGNFDRPNLAYRVVPRLDAMRQVREIVARHENEAVIIYGISRKDAERTAAYLTQCGVNSAPYHAGLSPEKRRQTQEAFSREKLNVVTATVAFGMGIDRSNVRCVIHTAMPKSIEHYQQETGRAGRDGLEAECVMLYSQADVMRWESLMDRSAQEAKGNADAVVAGKIIEAGRGLLAEMQKFCSGTVCRHRALVEYFGQSYESDDCNACDVCLNEIDTMPDSTVLAQKIISCVARLKERFGITHIVDVLTGANTDLIRKCHHEDLSTFGLVSDIPKRNLVNLTHQLIDQGVLSRTPGDRPVVTLNERSASVLRGEEEVQLIRPMLKETKKSRFDSESWDGVDRDLFEKLRELRREIATTRNVPPYVIFGDATLRDLARRRPGTVEHMRSVWGVGERKVADLGKQFVETICVYCESAGVNLDAVVPDATSAAPARAAIPAAAYAAFDLFRAGQSVEVVMSKLERARSTTMTYLETFIKEESPDDLSPWVSAETEKRIREAASEAGTHYLRPIRDQLNNEVDYDEIRIVIARMRHEEATPK